MTGGWEIADGRGRNSARHAVPNRLLAVSCWLSAPAPLLANTNSGAGPEEIPPLRPPKPQIPPGTWEQHGLSIGIAAAVLILAIGLLWRRFARPKPVVPPDPATVARHGLEPLRGRTEDAVLLCEVSRILRAYFQAALALPGDALTNAELCDHLEISPRLTSPLAAEASDLLRRMDHRRFNDMPAATPPLAAPASGGPGPDVAGNESAVERALWLIRKTETELRPATGPGAADRSDA